jgi:hypothetical protein
VLLREALRAYRNALVEFVRKSLTATYGAQAAQQVASLYAKVDEKTGLTRWQQMREAAERARATPEVSTEVADDFELLGVADFFSIFEKFFDQLFPLQTGQSKELRADFKAGVLRCARQVKVARDPTSHEVTEDSGVDEIVLAVSNIIILLKTCGLASEAAELRALLQGQLAAKPHFTTAMFKASGADSSFTDGIVRRLQAEGVKPSRIDLSDAEPLDDDVPEQPAPLLPSQRNIVVALETIPQPGSALAASINHAHRLGKRVIVVTATSDPNWPKHAVALGVPQSCRVTFPPEYASEATQRILERLVPEPLKAARAEAPAPSVPVAEAVLDGKLRAQLFNELVNPNLKRVWLVSPFVTDVGNLTISSGQLSARIGRERKRGVEVTLITRPPSANEGIASKREFLDRLERDGVQVLVNQNLHAKIYLFDAAPATMKWYLGSHNLTEGGLGKWREASMYGSREAEYRQAHNAMVSVREDRKTEPYNIWKAREARRPMGSAQ